MTHTPDTPFNPKKDFLAPIGVFAERLLGQDIKQTREHAAHVQALFVVFDRYMLVDDNLPVEHSGDIESQKKKYKEDFFFRNMGRDTQDLKNELAVIVPGHHVIDDEIKQAQELVDSGKGVPNVPPLGMILAKRLPKNVIDANLQVQAGLRIIAITDQLEGHEKIVPARVFDTDPKELRDIQTALNDVRENYADKTENDLQRARALGLSSIADAQDKLLKAGQSKAVQTLQDYLQIQHSVTEKFASNKSLQNPSDVEPVQISVDNVLPKPTP